MVEGGMDALRAAIHDAGRHSLTKLSFLPLALECVFIDRIPDL